MLEHRFFGTSDPRNDLSTQSLRLHTVQQAVNDLAYFAQNADLALPGGASSAPAHTPWVLVGGSYAGALTAWTMQK